VSCVGLLDMAGNVREWCSDWYGAGYYAKSSRRNPRGPAEAAATQVARVGKCRVARGGSFMDCDAEAFSRRTRGAVPGAYRGHNIGFRCALNFVAKVPPKPKVKGGKVVFLPAGGFTMGADERGQVFSPAHTVQMSGYWMDVTEVTNAQYAEFLKYIKRTGDHSMCHPNEPAGKDHTPDHWAGDLHGKRKRASEPVVWVDWYDAYAYAAWAGKRLPTEAEWEKAARGANERLYPWGNRWDRRLCNSMKSGLETQVAVGRYPRGKSPAGCLDMAGNVAEWCADWLGAGYYSSSPGGNPDGPEKGDTRVMRGGSWESLPQECRAIARLGGSPTYRSGAVGFRCAADS